MWRNLLVVVCILFLSSCKEKVLPKPKAFLSLEYPTPEYSSLTVKRPYVFEVSHQVQVLDEANNWLKIKYPNQKATIDVTYRKINNNLKELLLESEKLVFKHTVKAEEIASNDFVNDNNKVYGTLHEITGNAASQIQFHLTDSTHNFIKGALYFKVKPNYDSVLPAVNYIKNDIFRLIESLEWKN